MNTTKKPLNQNRMKTAVEWLEDNLISEPWTEEHFKHNSECWDKAKEMDKAERAKEYLNGFKDGKEYMKKIQTFESK